MQLSSYRLGDLVLQTLNEDEINKLLSENPNSFGATYILAKRQHQDWDNIDLITKIVLDNIENKSEFLPKDIATSTVIHLRLGDVIAGNEWHEKMKRPFDVSHIKSLIANDMNKKYIIGKCFFAETSSNNYNECIEKSNKYLQLVLDETQAEHFDSGSADIDLLCAVMAKVFIQGKGMYSGLIVKIREHLSLYNIGNSPQIT